MVQNPAEARKADKQNSKKEHKCQKRDCTFLLFYANIFIVRHTSYTDPLAQNKHTLLNSTNAPGRSSTVATNTSFCPRYSLQERRTHC